MSVLEADHGQAALETIEDEVIGVVVRDVGYLYGRPERLDR